ncbi:MAG: ABC transporter ATP-binding protein [Pseudomonadota bacterium]
MAKGSHDNLLEVEDLYVYFPLYSTFMRKSRKVVKAVDGVSLYIRHGETVGLVGESGCGKTTLGLSAIRLIDPSAGRIFVEGKNLLGLSKRKMRSFRRNLQVIFQNPYGSLNPRMKILQILGEGMRVHGLVRSRREQREKVREALEMVGLDAKDCDSYPHEFSGGERQRICIARAICIEPKLIVADEALSALDVSVQAQIANLMKELQERLRVAFFFISHDLKMIKFMGHIICVMYLGKIVEIADAGDLFLTPMHPYTRALMESIPLPDPQEPSPWHRKMARGEIPSPLNPPSGCRFRTRCEFAFDKCSEEEPFLVEIKPKHKVACHLVAD